MTSGKRQAVFFNEKNLLTEKLNIELITRIVKYAIWSVVLYIAETNGHDTGRGETNQKPWKF